MSEPTAMPEQEQLKALATIAKLAMATAAALDQHAAQTQALMKSLQEGVRSDVARLVKKLKRVKQKSKSTNDNDAEVATLKALGADLQLKLDRVTHQLEEWRPKAEEPQPPLDPLGWQKAARAKMGMSMSKQARMAILASMTDTGGKKKGT